MENLKIRVNSYSEIKEAEKILLKLGFSRVANAYSEKQSGMVFSDGHVETHLHKLITLDQLRQMVNQMKEYLVKQNDEYVLVNADKCPSGGIEVPEGSEIATISIENEIQFWRNNGISWWSKRDKLWKELLSLNHHIECSGHKIIWQRPTQPEELPFIDDEPINPQHYKNGKVECIDALESATVNKTGIEAVCVANIIKYLWRYEDKNGIEDVKKAKWYLEKLLEKLNEN